MSLLTSKTNFTSTDLIRELEEVFPPLSLDGGVSLRQAYLDDDEWVSVDDPRMQQAYDQDVTDDWKKISDQELASFFNSFSVFTYLDLKGWRYYLPAAIRLALRDFDSEAETWTYMSLTQIHLDCRERMAPQAFIDWLQFDLKQARFITRWLKYCLEQKKSHQDISPDEEMRVNDWVNTYLEPQCFSLGR
jgi:hypothetical protein